MGNNASTPQTPGPGAGGSSSRTPGGGGNRGSPRTRNVPLPSLPDDPPSRSRQHSASGSAHADRKGSLRKSTTARDSAHGSSPASTPASPKPHASPSLSHSASRRNPAVPSRPSATGAPGPPPPAAAATAGRPSPAPSSAGLGLLGAVGGPRRKLSDRVPIVDDSEGDGDNQDDGEDAPQGTLRGALQGKAEHVVYGPRRGGEDAESRNVLMNPPSAAHQETLSKPVGIAIPGTGPAAIPLRTPGGGAAGTAAGGSLTNAGMGAIGADALIDPDDQSHPGFGASARLTSEVMASTDRMPVVNSPKHEDLPSGSPFTSADSVGTKMTASALDPVGAATATPDDASTVASTAAPTPSHSHEMLLDPSGSRRQIATPQTSFAGALSGILAPAATAAAAPVVPGHSPMSPPTEMHELPPPHTSSATPPISAPNDTVQAPPVPDEALPIASDEIPSGTSVIASPPSSVPGSPAGTFPSPAVLLPPAVINAPVAAIPIPLLSVPSQTVAQNLIAAAVDLGAGDKGVPTLIKWKDEDGQERADDKKGKKARGPKEVFVTGTFAKGWKTKIELRKTE